MLLAARRLGGRRADGSGVRLLRTLRVVRVAPAPLRALPQPLQPLRWWPLHRPSRLATALPAQARALSPLRRWYSDYEEREHERSHAAARERAGAQAREGIDSLKPVVAQCTELIRHGLYTDAWQVFQTHGVATGWVTHRHYTTLVTACLDANAHDQVERYVQHLLDAARHAMRTTGAGSAPLPSVSDPTAHIRERHARQVPRWLRLPSVTLYNRYLKSLAANGRLERALEVVREMQSEFRLEINAVTWSMVILAAGRAGQFDRMIAIYQDLKTQALLHDQLTAEQAAEEMRAQLEEPARDEDDADAEYDERESAPSPVRRRYFTPSCELYSLMIMQYQQSKEPVVDAVTAILKEMRSCGVTADERVCLAVIRVLTKDASLPHMELVLDWFLWQRLRALPLDAPLFLHLIPKLARAAANHHARAYDARRTALAADTTPAQAAQARAAMLRECKLALRYDDYVWRAWVLYAVDLHGRPLYHSLAVGVLRAYSTRRVHSDPAMHFATKLSAPATATASAPVDPTAPAADPWAKLRRPTHDALAFVNSAGGAKRAESDAGGEGRVATNELPADALAHFNRWMRELRAYCRAMYAALDTLYPNGAGDADHDAAELERHRVMFTFPFPAQTTVVPRDRLGGPLAEGEVTSAVTRDGPREPGESGALLMPPRARRRVHSYAPR